MNRKLLFLCLCSVIIFASGALMAATDSGPLEASKTDNFRGSLNIDAVRAACTISKANMTPASIGFFNFALGDAVATYFDPTDPVNGGCADATPYPYEISSFTFALWDMSSIGISAPYPVQVDIVIYAIGGTADCVAPGNELCRYTVTVDNSFDLANGGNTVNLSPTCCVDGPFFIGLEYTDTGTGPFPSIVFDDNTAPVTCDNYFYYNLNGFWSEWYTAWGAPIPGYPLFAVGGETKSANCGNQPWTPGDPHKMHYPQLPDEAGWDVNATFPQILADDWQCSESGYIKDLHFWGSWLDGFTGDIDHFIISFHEDIPAIDPVPFPVPLPWVPIPGDVMVITDGLPQDATIEIHPKFSDPSCDAGRCDASPDPDKCEQPNPGTGGTHYCDIEIVALELVGTGPLGGFTKTIVVPAEFEVELGPRDQGASNRTVQTEILSMDLAIFGDPDFDVFEIKAGRNFGLPPSTGQTNLTRLGPPGSDFQVDSFFDITYRIDYQGAPGGALSGLSGSSTGNIRMEQKDDDLVSQGTVSPSAEKYSRPGATIMEFDVYNFAATSIIPATLEGWYDPATGDTQWNNHQEYFQYDMFFTDPDLWLWQDAGTIYWVNISAVLNDVGEPAVWGWKSTLDHWNDDAVWSHSPDLTWVDIWEPAVPISNTFWASNGGGVFSGGGEGAFGDQWYDYPSGWTNIWFYDHPLALDRKKDFHVLVEVYPLDPAVPMDVTFAINWSTDKWDGTTEPPLPGTDEDLYIRREIFDIVEGPNEIYYEFLTYNPEWVSIDIIGTNYRIEGVIDHTCRGSLDLAFVVTGDPNEPNQTGACCYEDAIGVATCQVMLETDCLALGGIYAGDGTNCSAPEACCLPDGSCEMLDPICCELLGGKSGGPGTTCTTPEACCLPDGTCAMLDPLCCTDLGGTPEGAGTQCSAPEACCIDGADCQMLDPLCCENLGGLPGGPGSTCTTPEACCLPDGTCQNLDPLCCEFLGGIPQGAGTDCTNVTCDTQPDGACCYPNPDGTAGTLCSITTQDYCINTLGGTYLGDGTTCTAPEACCLPDGTCDTIDPLCCEALGGTPQGAGTDCASSDCAVVPYTPKNWYQPPDLTENGIDVHATYPEFVLAEDFECRETSGIQEIHIWGSWYDDIFPASTVDPPDPNGDPANVSFHISIHSDIPVSPTQNWSMPGPMIMDWIFTPGQFLTKRVNLKGDYEGWMTPPDVWIANGDRNCFEYIFQFDETNWFIQQGTPSNPVVYWVDVQAIVPDSPLKPLFGWKTSTVHWNDDAVWTQGEDLPGQLQWNELIYPNGHPYSPESIDQSLLISGPCDCEPGDVDGTPPINILDIVWLINYKYKNGSTPGPYALCSGDANCDCNINILDIVYLINYKYKGGSHPCTCGNFVANCPGGLR